jgi:hypothetical protein
MDRHVDVSMAFSASAATRTHQIRVCFLYCGGRGAVDTHTNPCFLSAVG